MTRGRRGTKKPESANGAKLTTLKMEEPKELPRQKTEEEMIERVDERCYDLDGITEICRVNAAGYMTLDKTGVEKILKEVQHPSSDTRFKALFLLFEEARALSRERKQKNHLEKNKEDDVDEFGSDEDEDDEDDDEDDDLGGF